MANLKALSHNLGRCVILPLSIFPSPQSRSLLVSSTYHNRGGRVGHLSHPDGNWCILLCDSSGMVICRHADVDTRRDAMRVFFFFFFFPHCCNRYSPESSGKKKKKKRGDLQRMSTMYRLGFQGFIRALRLGYLKRDQHRELMVLWRSTVAQCKLHERLIDFLVISTYKHRISIPPPSSPSVGYIFLGDHRKAMNSVSFWPHLSSAVVHPSSTVRRKQL